MLLRGKFWLLRGKFSLLRGKCWLPRGKFWLLRGKFSLLRGPPGKFSIINSDGNIKKSKTSYRKKFLNPTRLSLEELMTLSNPELQRATLVQQYLLATAELRRLNEFELTD